MVIPVEPNGSLILADDTPYSSAWDGSGKSASQDAVYDQVENVKSDVATKANIVSPIFTGNVVVPNQTLGDSSTKAANTNFVAAGLADNVSTTNTALALKAPLVSPTFTGDPKAPTPVTTDNDTSIATTAYVKSNLASYATLISPTFTGSVVVPSQAANDNSTKAANTTYVDTGLALKANLASPTFTGDPKAPTPTTTDNDTSIATTAFVKNVIGGLRNDSAGTWYIRPDGSNLMIKFGTSVVTTAGEVAIINYNGTPAFTSILTVICCNGDASVTTSSIMVQSFNATNFVVRSVGISGNVRVNWIAIGNV
ncbi:hypothetical protein [Nostoc sp.]|uniref:hypothetical protein n=1 Tax=Nostoc sp. TaxID=1180 RepID=UPI002FF8A6F9